MNTFYSLKLGIVAAAFILLSNVRADEFLIGFTATDDEAGESFHVFDTTYSSESMCAGEAEWARNELNTEFASEGLTISQVRCMRIEKADLNTSFTSD